ncbi:tumor protein p63-regulated gene 1-like protein, partial [Discoglossus pictus]
PLLRPQPPLLHQAIQDVKGQLSGQEDGDLQSVWILTQVTHWGSQCELLAFLTERSLLFCYYDFVGLSSSRLFRVPLNYIDTVTWGPLVYPRTALNKLQGPALKVQWDKFRAQPSFLSRWNPWADDFPYIILTQHPRATTQGDTTKPLEESTQSDPNQLPEDATQRDPVTPPEVKTERGSSKSQEDLQHMFMLEQFMEHLLESVKQAHRVKPLPGRANGLLVLHRSVDIDISLGLFSFFSSKIELGFAKSRWRFGF